MNDTFTKIGVLEDYYFKQQFTVLKSEKYQSYYLLNDLIHDHTYLNNLNSFDRLRHSIKGIVANTVISSTDYVTVLVNRNTTFSILKNIFKPSTDPSLIQFIHWREKVMISDIHKFIGCTRILQSFRLDENEIPVNAKDNSFDQKIFAYVLAEFEYKGEYQQKLFLQITESEDYTSVQHIEITWDMYYFSKLRPVQRHFLIDLLT
ncbi:hypothetical protein [Spirosoma areae]